ncbi:MAG: NADH-quinone oxidoreductase subunit J [Candidatus Dormibacteria bacterium]
MNAILVIVGLLAAACAVGVVAASQILYSALFLVLNVGLLAVMYLVLNAQFLFAVQLIVYAGAVMVLFIFIIALLSPGSEDRPRRIDWKLGSGIVIALAFTALMVGLTQNGVTTTHVNGQTLLHGEYAGAAHDPYHAFAFTENDVNARGNVQVVGGQLFTVFLLPFEITSLLLFVAAVGAVYLTRKRQSR